MEDASLSFVSKRFLVKHRLLRRSSLRVAVHFFFLLYLLLINLTFSYKSSSREYPLPVNFLFLWISSSCDSFLFIISPLVYDLFSLFCGLFCLLLIIYWTFAFNKWKLSQASVAALDFVACQSVAATCRCLGMWISLHISRKQLKIVIVCIIVCANRE